MWKPGQSGNPGGRPSKTEEQRDFEEKCRKFLWLEGWAILDRMARSETTKDVRWALGVMLDRGFGRPFNSLEASPEPNQSRGASVEELTAMIDDLLGKPVLNMEIPNGKEADERG